MVNYKMAARKNLADQIMKNLKKRNMESYYCQTKEEALQQAISLLPEGCSVSWGGSTSLEEIGFMDYIEENSDKYTVFNRFIGKTNEEKRELYAKGALSDVYFMSSNAITKDGILVNMDGSGNRVASLCHGPNQVVLIVGMNKVAANLEEAIDRIHMIAGPTNVIRQQVDTPCMTTGSCVDCLSEECICCQLVITRFNRVNGRIHVILVGEDLGF